MWPLLRCVYGSFCSWGTAVARRRTIALLAAGAFVLVFISIFISTNEVQTFIGDRLGTAAQERIQNVFRPGQAREFGFRTLLWRFAFARIQASPLFGVEIPITLKNLYPTLPIDERGTLPLHNQVISSIYYGGYVAGALYVITHLWLLWISRKLRRQAIGGANIRHVGDCCKLVPRGIGRRKYYD